VARVGELNAALAAGGVPLRPPEPWKSQGDHVPDPGKLPSLLSFAPFTAYTLGTCSIDVRVGIIYRTGHYAMFLWFQRAQR
jgi:hypothetical protein